MLRADAFATLRFFHPLARLRRASARRVPILMYHSVTAGRTESTHPYYRTNTSPEIFARQMKYLYDNGYSTLRTEQVAPYIEGPGKTGARPVVVTFDDGYRDFYTDAFPVLQQYGFTATMYLPTAFIGEETREFKSMPCLNWKEVRELQQHGIEFGSHTVNHPQLRSLTVEQVREEVRASKESIEQALGQAVKSFAYPFAFPEMDTLFTGSLRNMLQEAGYENGVSTVIGTTDRDDDRFFMKRLPMNSCDDASLFEAKLHGGYDWLHSVQRTWKQVSGKG